VVCDGEDPATRDLSARYEPPFPMQWIFVPEPRGQAAAQNTGAAATTSDLLMFLDDDMPVGTDWIALHLQRHQRHAGSNRLAVVGRTVHNYSDPPSSRTERLYREHLKFLISKAEETLAQGGPDFIASAYFISNCSLPRSLFVALGGFDPALGYRARAEYEFGDRLYRSGARFDFEPRAIAYHHGSLDLVSDSRRLFERRGPSDLHRARHKNQRDPQTRSLTALLYGSPLRVSANRLAWKFPRLFDAAAAAAKTLTDLTGSRICFKLWRGFSISKYWQGVKDQGETAESLRALAGRPLPILMFHSISIPPRPRHGALSVSPSRFSALMTNMKKFGFQPVLPQNGELDSTCERPVLLTFDDGMEDFYTEALPVLERLGYKAMVFIVVGWIGKFTEWKTPGARKFKILSAKQMRELQRNGFQFGSHTLTHPWLTRLPDAELRREVKDSKCRLEDLLGTEVSSFAYPFGDVDVRVRAAVAEAGYKLALSTREGKNCWEDPLWLRRVGVIDADNGLSLRMKLATGRDYRASTLRWLAGRPSVRRLRTAVKGQPTPAQMLPQKRDDFPAAD
jgi:peptidoglycan/xylan/chitin deacetylase (PgdA/CDA1 family)/GT2 family glycosyltransferase